MTIHVVNTGNVLLSVDFLFIYEEGFGGGINSNCALFLLFPGQSADALCDVDVAATVTCDLTVFISGSAVWGPSLTPEGIVGDDWHVFRFETDKFRLDVAGVEPCAPEPTPTESNLAPPTLPPTDAVDSAAHGPTAIGLLALGMVTSAAAAALIVARSKRLRVEAK